MLVMIRKNKGISTHMRDKLLVERKTSIKYITSSVFTALLGRESIEQMIEMVRLKALEGDPRALYFCLERAAPNEKAKTYAAVRYRKKLETQKDIDDAMSAVVLSAMGGGDEQISLEEADMITNMLLRKKETMDECLHGEIVEIQKKIGMIS